MDKTNRESFFSISEEVVPENEVLEFDIFINSSGNEARDRFVKVSATGTAHSREELRDMKKKYHQLYVPELQRDLYLKSLVKSEKFTDVKKTEVIKDSAIKHLNRLFDKNKEFTNEVLTEAIEGCRDSIENMIDVIQDYDVTDVQNLIANLSFHDFYTYDHSINVAMYSIVTYRAIKPKASREELLEAGLGGLLHDLGKTKIPTHIINNPGNLSDEDFEQIKKHPDYGIELLDEHNCCNIKDLDFGAIRRVVHEHHENYNGSGYPAKVKGEDIHLMARVTAIADFYDAITTKRSYHEVLSTEDALQVMQRSVGRKIDPGIFEVFTQQIKDLVLKGKGNKQLPDSFDPCQPHNVLPFESVKAESQGADLFKKDKQDFGKVIKQDPKEKAVKKKKAS